MTKEREAQIDRTFMRIALEFAQLSYCKKAKVGAIIVSNRNIIGIGYNGMPSGFDNDAEEKVDGHWVTKSEVVHAEFNAVAKVAKSSSSCDGATMYVTLSPCMNCALLMLQSGIKEVIYVDEWRETKSLDILRKGGVRVRKITF
jgi:dCMP deaminase